MKRSPLAAEIPDWSEPAIGWESTIFDAPFNLMWFFTLDVSVIVTSVFQIFFKSFKTSNVCFGGTATIIRSTFFRKSFELISKIDSALKKINDGTYGFCEETGEPIGLKRLMARPVATLCIAAQEKHEKNEKVYADD